MFGLSFQVGAVPVSFSHFLSGFHTSCQVFTLPGRYFHFLSGIHTSCWIFTLHARFSHFPSGFPFLSDVHTSCQHFTHPRERIYFRGISIFHAYQRKNAFHIAQPFFFSIQNAYCVFILNIKVTFIRHLNFSVIRKLLHIMVVEWITVLCKMALDAMTVQNIIRVSVAFTTKNFSPGSGELLDRRWCLRRTESRW